MTVRWVAVALALVLVATACSDDTAAPGPNTTSTTTSASSTTSTSTTTLTPPEPPAGLAVWPLVDSVPAYRKAGVPLVAGASYEPVFGPSLEQERVELQVVEDRSVFGIAPERGSVEFDQIQLGGLTGSAEGWPFVVDQAGALSIFAGEAGNSSCAEVAATDSPFAEFSLAGDVDGRLAVTSVQCLDSIVVEDGVATGTMPTRTSGVRAFGVLLTLVGERATIETISFDWLALVDSTEHDNSADFVVEVVGLETSIAERSMDPDDDGSLSVLHVLRHDGTLAEVEAGPAGTFNVPRAELGSTAKLWIDDYGLEHYVQQGPWVDPDRLTRALTIDLTPTFEIRDEAPTGSAQNSRPHELQVWNGSAAMERQQYNGLTWNNNLGQADRDRDASNPNGCARAGWFGGSYVEALQTRVDQNPALIAEALLDLGSDRCHEVIAQAQDIFTVEKHFGNAQLLVEEFGVTQLVFAISNDEICRMHDVIYTQEHLVAADTPIHWRFVDGEIIRPVTRRNATEAEADPDLVRRSVCTFSGLDPAGAAGAAEMIDKLAQLTDLMNDRWPQVDVTYFLMKDVLAQSFSAAGNLLEACLGAGLDCVQLDALEAYEKPADLVATDYNPRLTRYVGDGHPNERANQAIARSLAELLEERAK